MPSPSNQLCLKDKSVHMLHKRTDDATGRVAATTVVVGVHIDAVVRKAIRLPEDVREKAMLMKEQEFESLAS